MIEKVLDLWAGSPLSRQITCKRVLPAQEAKLRDLPSRLPARLRSALAEQSIFKLYEHQHSCLEAIHQGHDLVVATPTASGKTLCYNLPVFEALLAEPAARALYLFPTKALARDQVNAARRLAGATGADIGVAVYDGDTPPDQRRAARRRARIIATNPEMLHLAILPHHPLWAELFAGLRFVVIDELHTYRGVFGSHLANVLRRLQRIAHLYGAHPLCIATSATIANPEELASQLIGRPASLIHHSGAPAGLRHFVMFNPPLIDPALGLRESYLKMTCRLIRDLVAASISTLVFCRTRLAVEVLVRLLRETLDLDDDRQVRGYRGGYLPGRRREVEHALRAGDTRVVVATSALELGIDIGSLDAVVMAGWPGSRAAAWQRAGRAGRRLEPSLAVLVASSEPTDQFVAADPDYLFGQAPEHARINPENPSILVPHLKCAACELPFTRQESFGPLDPRDTSEILDCLADAKLLHRSPSGYHYTGHPHPFSEVHLRSPLDENFVVVEHPGGEVIAEVDYHDAPLFLHDGAIYQLEGSQYQVLRLDHDEHRAHVSRVCVDYYTDAMTQTRVQILQSLVHDRVASQGEVHVVHRVIGFKKIKLHSGENLGYGDVNQPERQMHTTALWLTVPATGLDRTPAEIAEATLGVAHALHTVGALILMSDPRDLGRAVGDARSGWFAVSSRLGRGPYSTPDAPLDGPTAPTIFLFDRYCGGTGLCEGLFEQRRELVDRTRDLVGRCPCQRGCPGCIGPGGSSRGKRLGLLLLHLLHDHLAEQPTVSPQIAAAP